MSGRKISEILAEIDRLAPFATQMEFDNAGLLVGDGQREVSRVMICLDITPDIVAQAKNIGAQMIVSHHPVIFHPLKRLDSRDVAYLLAREDIAAIAAHTNYDMAEFGVNYHLSKALGLQNLQRLAGDATPEAVFGELPREMAPEEFARMVKETLSAGGVTLIDGGKPIRKVGLCSGAGGEYIFAAAAAGIDAFVTGEMKHHEQLFAHSAGITAVVAGHHETEWLAMPPLCDVLQKAFPTVEFVLASQPAPGRMI